MQAPTNQNPTRCGMRGIWLAVIATAFVSSAIAQVERQVTDADIQRAKKLEPKISAKDIERASRANPLLSDAEIKRAEGLSTPNVGAIPLPKGGAPIDLGAIAKGYEQLGQAGGNSSSLRADKKALLVFVSFSMPEKALIRLVEQAARTDATLVLRGLEGNSLRMTAARIKRLLGKNKVSFQIDPQAFDRFAIAAAPTFVLVKAGALPVPCASGTCVPAPNFVSASGDVSIDYALEYFQRSSPNFARDAGEFLAKFRRGT